MNKYKHIYIDLDRTLWDFEANAREAFREIFEMFDLSGTIPDFMEFIDTYVYYNEKLWEKYGKGRIKKELLRTERFRLTLNKFKIKDFDLVNKMSDAYMEITPQKSILVKGAVETLNYLHSKYNLYILTNGFPEVQYTKIKNCGIENFFLKIITSEEAGWHKPDKRIFQYALKCVNAGKDESIMIGDNLEIDIKGARNFGMDQVFYNVDNISHKVKVTFEIKEFIELMKIF